MEQGLLEALDAIDQGFLWLDEHLIVQQHNRAFRQLMELEDGAAFLGQSYRNLLEYLSARGEYANCDGPETFLAESLRAVQRREVRRIEQVRPDGTVLQIASSPLASGGVVLTYLDITRESRALETVQRNAKATLVAMANFAEHRDTDTGVHVLRVSRLVGQTAFQLKRSGIYPDIIDEEFVSHVGTASILHDVGKIATPDRILLKNGPLSNEERTTIKRHSLEGNLLLRQAHLMMGESTYLKLGAEIAMTHHEWFDGSGYPAGLAGDAIPVSGRICAIADVFDALTSRRPYKAPWSTEQAVEHLRQQSGTQFDPVVVDAFLEVIARRELVSVVQWSEAMSVGNLHIDEQHRILIDTINQLASAESQYDRPVLAMIIDELVSYAAFHFQYEEQLMESIGYPDIEQHRRIHEGFVKWVSGVREEFVFHRRSQFGERILNFLRDWLRDHILGEDQRYRPYIG